MLLYLSSKTSGSSLVAQCREVPKPLIGADDLHDHQDVACSRTSSNAYQPQGNKFPDTARPLCVCYKCKLWKDAIAAKAAQSPGLLLVPLKYDWFLHRPVCECIHAIRQ